MSSVFFNSSEVYEFEEAWLDRLRNAANAASLKRSRLCLHLDATDAVQEMVIALHRDSYIRPHRHPGKSESFHIIEGELKLVFFDDKGSVTRRIHMGPLGSGHTFLYRMSSALWHSVIPISQYAVIHEVTCGPFEMEDCEWALWSPEQDDIAGIRAFLDRIV